MVCINLRREFQLQIFIDCDANEVFDVLLTKKQSLVFLGFQRVKCYLHTD